MLPIEQIHFLLCIAESTIGQQDTLESRGTVGMMIAFTLLVARTTARGYVGNACVSVRVENKRIFVPSLVPFSSIAFFYIPLDNDAQILLRTEDQER